MVLKPLSGRPKGGLFEKKGKIDMKDAGKVILTFFLIFKCSVILKILRHNGSAISKDSSQLV